jgi:hypothetical protein
MLIFALIFSAGFVGCLTTAMTRLVIIASERSAQFAALHRYLKDAGISLELSVRVQRSARNIYAERKRNTSEQDVELVAWISDRLRMEIHYEITSPLLTCHPFFNLYDKALSAGVRHICHKAITELSISRADVLFAELELPACPAMFIVSSGKFHYSQGIAQPRTISAKQWISEAVLWTSWAYLGTLQAVSDCQLLALESHSFHNIVSMLTTLHACSYAKKFVALLNQFSDGDLSDIGDLVKSGDLALNTFIEQGQNRSSVLSMMSKKHGDQLLGLSGGYSQRSTLRPSMAIIPESFFGKTLSLASSGSST